MSEKLGTENLERGVLLAVDFANKIDEATDDGFQPVDLLAIAGPAMQVQGVLKTGPEMKAELDDFSMEERTGMKTKIKDQLQVGDAKEELVDDVVSDAADWLAASYKLQKSIRALRSVAS